MDVAQFIMEADATSLVAASQLQKRVLRDAEAEMRRVANETKRMDEEGMKRLRERAALVLKEREIDKQLAQAKRDIGKASDENAKKHDRNTNDAVRSTRRWRDALNQVSYGLGDIMSVQGGMAEMIRASANNVQYMIAQIPGKIGAIAMVGAVAAQGIGMMAAKLGTAVDLTKEAEKAAKAASKAYSELVDEVEKATFSEQEYDKERQRRTLNEKVAKMEQAAQAARDVLTNVEQKIEGVGSSTYWEPLKALTNLVVQKAPNLAMNVLSGQGFSAVGPIEGIADTEYEYREAQQKLVARENEAAAARKLRDEAMRGFAEQREAKKLEQPLEKLRPMIEEEYFRRRARGIETPESIRETLLAQFQVGLGGGGRGGRGIAERALDKMIEEFRLAMSKSQFESRYAEMTPQGGDLMRLRQQAEMQKIQVDKTKAEQLSDGERSKMDNRLIKLEEDRLTQIEAQIKVIEENNRLLLENNRRMAAEQDNPEQVPPFNPQANN